MICDMPAGRWQVHIRAAAPGRLRGHVSTRTVDVVRFLIDRGANPYSKQH